MSGADRTRYTVLGGTGFVGRHLVAHLKARGLDVLVPPRGSDVVFREELGHVFFCIGMTADWRQRPLDAVHAHVGRLVDLLERARFDSLLYLSSTRVYKRAHAAREDSPLVALPAELDDLFDLSKMLGESACLADARRTRVVRLSNVFGDDLCSENFLSSVLRDAVRGKLVLRSALESAKDYVSVADVAELLPRIALAGAERVYNVASGQNTSHRQIADEVARLTGCTLEVVERAPVASFPAIAVDRIASEFGFIPRPVISALPQLVEIFRSRREHWERA
jgi:nucleoside-diphosphate-sugar epimerase